MTAFTDKDLKLLKGYIDNHEFPEQGSGLVVALLARLEAAETCARFAEDYDKAFGRNPLWKAWLASKGEEK